MTVTNNNDINQKKPDDLLHLLSLIKDANRLLTISKSENDKLGVRQYLHLRSKLVKELSELLEPFNLTIQVKKAA